jgi:DNA-binding NtrC family response regulator
LAGARPSRWTRVITATNRNLEDEIRAGRFARISLPAERHADRGSSLRDRREDIPLLANFFVKHYAEKTGASSRLTPRPGSIYAVWWPGNVRELENVIERAVIMARGDMVAPVPEAIQALGESSAVTLSNFAPAAP